MSNEKTFPDWMSVKENGYPPYNLGVLVFIPEEDYHITSGMWDISNKWVLLDEYREPECEVTHWMPVPNIPPEYLAKRKEEAEAMKWLGEALRAKIDSNPGAFKSPYSKKVKP